MKLPPGPRSLRWRLLWATLSGAALTMLLAGWLLARVFDEQVQRQFTTLLSAQLDQVLARVEPGSGGEPTLDPARLSDPRWLQPYSGLYWQVDERRNGGWRRAVLRSRSLWDAELLAPADALADGELHVHAVPGPGGSRLRLVERQIRVEGSAGWRVMVAADLRETEAAAGRFHRVLFAALALLLVLLLAAAAAQVLLGLAPLRTLQQALAALRQGRAPRLIGRFPSEVQPLVDDFNSVLDSQAGTVERARTAAGNLAHALKTPLAALLQAADGAARRPDALAELPAQVQDQVARARRQIDWHLARARAAAAHAQPGLRTPLAPVVDGLVRVMSRVHAERGLQWQVVPIDPALAFAGEGEDLHEMVGNLLDNAGKWARQRVSVEAARLAAAGAPVLRIRIDDDGPGIAAERRLQALTRGARLDESVPGSGLGLAIVHELAGLYGGQLTLGDSPGGGLRAELQVTAAPSRG
ncbi:ATP-binding protein [Aquabacterium sp.]|uniref:ATP-binding protein n=1 Tax=Aquabacterium sp. TaxID=1872578 RepID=UPI0037835111